MSEATMTLTQEQETQRDEFIERILTATAGFFEISTMFIGHKLGLYKALAEYGAMTSTALAKMTDTQERYVREWLEQQTVAGILTVKDEEKGALERCFVLNPAYHEVLADTESLNYIAPLAQLAVGAVLPIEKLLDAYRNGGGVSYSNYGDIFIEGQADINRAMFLQELGQDWLPSVPDVHARLQAEEPARVADIGCGVGWSTIGIAQAYPNVRVDGIDPDALSIEKAWANLKDVGLNGRVNFLQRDAGDAVMSEHYDLVTAFECVHDMADPVGVLSTMRDLLNEDGTVIIADERVGETFTANGNEVEWMMYGWSVLHCLPVGMAEHPSAATGTVMRTSTLESYAAEAGFSKVEVLPIENFFFRVYRLHI